MFTLKLALRPWKLQPLSQILSFSTLSVLLLLAGFFASLAHSLPGVRRNLEGDQIASIFVDPAIEPGQLGAIRDQIRTSAGSALRVDYVDSNAFLEAMARDQPELAKEISTLGSEKEWIVPKHFSIRGTIGDPWIEKIRTIPGVESVAFSARRFKPIVENIAAMEWLSRVLFAAIVLTMVAVLALLGRLNASVFSEAETIVAQMGGATWEARLPSRLSPILLAVSAGGVASLLYLKLNPWFTSKMATLSPYFSGIERSAISAPMLFLFSISVGMVAFILSPRSETAAR